MAETNNVLISPEKLVAKFREALDEKWGYIYGMTHTKWTQAQQDKYDKAKADDQNCQNSIKYGKKWIGHWVTDCSGLFAWAFKELGGYMYHGSNTMYKSYCTNKGQLQGGKRTDGAELKSGTAVFTGTEGSHGHVGLYIGGGYVIEAKGAYYGVVKTSITDKRWTFWGELKGVDYGNTAPAAKPAEEQKAWPTLRKGNKNQYVKEMQTDLDKLGYSLGICGIDGDFGTATEKAVKEFQRDHGLTQDGICGTKTRTALEEAVQKLEEKPAEKTYTVTIKGLSKAKAEEITRAYGGTVSAE